MKITESRLRKMIRGVIREFTSSATAAGAKKGGYQSADTRSKEKTYDTKKSAYDTKKSAYDTKKSTADTKASAATATAKALKALKGKEFVSLYTGKVKKGQPTPPPRYSPTKMGPMGPPGYGPYGPNPAFATAKTADAKAQAAKTSADTAKSTANTAKASAKAAWDTAKASDLQRTVPKQRPPTGGGKAGFGKGKSTGKAGKKGKKKKG